MSGIIAALISGTLMSVQGVFNTQVTRQTGTWVTNTFVQFTAFLVCLLIWLIRESKQTPLFQPAVGEIQAISLREA